MSVKKEKETGAEMAPKVFIVKAPVEGYCGVNAGGVQFAYGQAEVNEGWVLDWYRENGYTVKEKGSAQEAEQVEE